jgi:hypothetical protein
MADITYVADKEKGFIVFPLCGSSFIHVGTIHIPSCAYFSRKGSSYFIIYETNCPYLETFKRRLNFAEIEI